MNLVIGGGLLGGASRNSHDDDDFVPAAKLKRGNTINELADRHEQEEKDDGFFSFFWKSEKVRGLEFDWARPEKLLEEEDNRMADKSVEGPEDGVA